MAETKRSVLRIVHIMFAGRYLSGREVVVADLAEAQNDCRSSRARIIAIGRREHRTYFRNRGLDIALAVPGPWPIGWLRVLLYLRRTSPPIHPVDVMHAHGVRALMLVATLRLCRGGRGRANSAVVYTNHGFVETSRWRRMLSWIEPFCYRWVDRIVVCSPHQLVRLATSPGRRPVDLVLNGVAERPVLFAPQRDEARRRLGLPVGSLVIGIVARLAVEKRHDVFLDAGARLVASRPDAILLIVGDGPRRSEIQAMVQTRRLAEHVRFAGHVRDICGVYAAVDVLLLTSDTEGTPLALLEAMVAGVPVVSTAVGGVPALISNGVHGMLTPPRQPDLLARAVLRVLDDDQLRMRMVDAARERVAERLSLARMCAELDEVYAAALATGPPSAATVLAAGAELGR